MCGMILTSFYYQKEKSKRVLSQRKTIKCLPTKIHWHGASRNSEFTHIAISNRDNGPAKWFQPVTDDKYSK